MKRAIATISKRNPFRPQGRLVASSFLIACLLVLQLANGQQSSAYRDGQMYVPPTQRVVRAVVSDGVLLSRGSVTNGSPVNAEQQLFVVDTSATSTIVDPALGRGLGGKGTVGERLPDKTLWLAGARISHHPVVVFPLTAWEHQTGEHLAGIAGADIFDHLAARIDYVNQELTLIVPESCSPSPDALRLRVIGGLPFLEASLETTGGQSIRGLFLIDTGQSGPALVLTSEFLNAHPEIAGNQPVVHLPVFDDTGAVRSAAFLRIPGLELGKYSLHNVLVSVAPRAASGVGATLAGVIGGGILGHFDVLVDIPQASIVLTPTARYSAPFEADMAGLLLLRNGERNKRSGESAYTIAAIAEKSPAAEAGLRTGDTIEEIAGQKADTMSMEQLRSIFRSAPGAKVLVSFARAGKKMQVTLTLRRAV
jgi:hypothetical protein